MQTKLTLRMDRELIRKAKQWAAANDESLSAVVARFFALLSAKTPGAEPDTPILRKWRRELKGSTFTKKDYVDYLEKKYR